MTGVLGSPNPAIVSLDEEGLQELYTWIDEISLSRDKRNIWRDFSDGVLVAEIAAHFLPKLVEIHNYPSANSRAQKLNNWDTLNRKVFSKLNYSVSKSTIDDVSSCKPGTIELVLANLRVKIEKYLAKKKADSLRNQRKVYDEFYPNGPIPDGDSYLYTNGQTHLGSENLYGPIFNIGYSQPSNPNELVGTLQDSLPLSMAQQPPYSQEKTVNDSPRGANTRQKSKDVKVPSYAGSHGEKVRVGTVHPGKGKVPRSHSYQDINGTVDHQNPRLLLEEKEQALLASQETIQILNVKIRRLEHLLHLKDLRIDDLTKRLQQATQPPPRQLPPQPHPPQPLTVDQSLPSMQMHHQYPLPPVHHSSNASN